MSLHDQLTAFLLDECLGEERAGYGHPTCEHIADVLIEHGWVTGTPDQESDDA